MVKLLKYHESEQMFCTYMATISFKQVFSLPFIQSKSDFLLGSVEKQKIGPSYWKLNWFLMDDPDYINLLNILKISTVEQIIKKSRGQKSHSKESFGIW